MIIDHLIGGFSKCLNGYTESLRLPSNPWEITRDLDVIISLMMTGLGADYVVSDRIAIHKSATIEEGATIKGPTIIEAGCFVGAHAYLRDGVFLDNGVRIGSGCEIKTSLLFAGSAAAHFNYIGNSVIGQNVNFEAGAVIANHYNERNAKEVSVLYEGEVIATGSHKFGALVGDNCKIGANAVLSPGTLLPRNTIVKRLELVEQVI